MKTIETHLLLQKYLAKKKKSVAGYSLRLLAKQLDVSHSFLSRVMSGKKPIPYVLLLRFQKALDIEAEVFDGIRRSHEVIVNDQASVPLRGRASVQANQLDDWSLSGKQVLKILRQWFYVAILDLTLLNNFDGSVDMIAARLQISKTTAEVAVRELLALELLKVDENGRIVKSERKLHFGSAVSREEVRIFHDQMLKRAQLELKTATSAEDFERRLISGITTTVPTKKVAQVKQRISEFMHELANELIADEGDEVYQMGVQFFPLTHAVPRSGDKK